jgi:polyvinyl alcohol dehydrogenase (cytochrome)
MAAIRVADGQRLWRVPLNSQLDGPRISNGAPASAIPGAVMVGGSDGRVAAVAMADGRTLWSTETAHAFDTVNKVPAKGGSIISIGPTFAGGMMFIGSGYAVAGGQPGNALLAYAVQ